MKLPTPEEVIEAYERTGLKPITVVTLAANNTVGCAMGALALQHGITHDVISHCQERYGKSFPGSFGCGFDNGFTGKHFPLRRPESDGYEIYERGRECGAAVREWWAAKQNMPDYPPAGLQLQKEEVAA